MKAQLFVVAKFGTTLEFTSTFLPPSPSPHSSLFPCLSFLSCSLPLHLSSLSSSLPLHLSSLHPLIPHFHPISPPSIPSFLTPPHLSSLLLLFTSLPTHFSFLLSSRYLFPVSPLTPSPSPLTHTCTHWRSQYSAPVHYRNDICGHISIVPCCPWTVRDQTVRHIQHARGM